MVDLGSYDLVAAMREPGCPMCRVVSVAEVRAMDAFVEQAGTLQETLASFCERGGFCREHAWLFHRRAALSLTGVPVAQMYEALVRRDIAHLEQLEHTVATSHGRRRPERLLDRRTCLPCEQADERLRAKAAACASALEEAQVQQRYEASDGLCLQHLDLVGAEALQRRTAVAGFLIRDLRRRLEHLEHRLAEYERTRDYRYQSECIDTDAWTDVVRSYVGDQYAAG